MMTKEEQLKKIKKLFGEEMAHFCQTNCGKNFEKNVDLFELMKERFSPSRQLIVDIKNQGKENLFADFLLTCAEIKDDEKLKSKKTPFQIAKEKGYTLHECKTVDSCKEFEKHYAKYEKICTLRTDESIKGRLNYNHIFFAVKDDIENIKRENFKDIRREDDYSISCMSIQVSKKRENCPKSSVKIISRYNHSLDNNPDCVFSGNLDNIAEGFADSFEEYLDLEIGINKTNFELDDYVMAGGKFYKYNNEINGVYYTANNELIMNGEVTTLDKSDYILADYFKICKNKEKGLSVELVDEDIGDSFVDLFKDGIDKIEELSDKKTQEKTIFFTLKNGDKIEIVLNADNNIVGLNAPNVKEIGDDFFQYNKTLTSLNMPELETMGEECFCINETLTSLNMPELETMGEKCFYYNNTLTSLNLPNLERMGEKSFFCNRTLTSLNMPNIKILEGWCFCDNSKFGLMTSRQIREQSKKMEIDNQLLK